MVNMPEVTNEVEYMLGYSYRKLLASPPAEIGRFGAKMSMILSWVNVMNCLFLAPECGSVLQNVLLEFWREKNFLPRKNMMDVSEIALKEVWEKYRWLASLDLEGWKIILGGLTLPKRNWNACTSCNCFCVEGLGPINIDPLSIILKIAVAT